MATEVGWDGCVACLGCAECNESQGDCCNDCTGDIYVQPEKCDSCGQTLREGKISVTYSNQVCNCEGHDCLP